MFQKCLTAAFLSLALFMGGCSDTPGDDAQSLTTTSEFTLSDTQGNTVTVNKDADTYRVQGHENKIVLFDIFATWCPPCRATAPHLTSLQSKYPDELLVLGVTIEDDKSHADMERFKQENNADYVILNDRNNRLLTKAIASSIHVGQRYPIPLLVLYKNGEYYTHYVGATPEEMIESDIRQALGK